MLKIASGWSRGVVVTLKTVPTSARHRVRQFSAAEREYLTNRRSRHRRRPVICYPFVLYATGIDTDARGVVKGELRRPGRRGLNFYEYLGNRKKFRHTTGNERREFSPSLSSGGPTDDCSKLTTFRDRFQLSSS